MIYDILPDYMAVRLPFRAVILYFFPIISHVLFFFFNDTATTEIYTLSLHDALPIFQRLLETRVDAGLDPLAGQRLRDAEREDRKSTRLNSSHANISYAVFCLKKKKTSYMLDCCVVTFTGLIHDSMRVTVH